MAKIIEIIKKKSFRQDNSNVSSCSGHIGLIPKIMMTLDEEDEPNERQQDSSTILINAKSDNNKNEYSQSTAVSTMPFSSVNNRITLAPDGNHNRKQSTGTLNRLILVAQALESEVDSRQRNDVNGTRIINTIRAANVILLLLINILIATGAGRYRGRKDRRLSLLLTIDKWHFRHDANLPATFAEMRLKGQYLSQTLSVVMLFITAILQILHYCQIQHSKLLCICYSFGCVPFSLLIFGLEMHYSACPWLDDFYRSEVLRQDFHVVEKYFDTQCGINGWALAGIFSLLSCGLFVSEGLITVFFRSGASHNEPHKMETIL